MRRFRWLLIGSLILAGAGAAGLAIRRAAARDGGGGRGTMRVLKVWKRAPGEAGPPRADPLADPHGIGGMGLDRLSVDVDGRIVTISGAADVSDRRPDRVYVWLVRVWPYDAGTHRRGPLLREYHYLQQAMMFPAGRHRMTPKFHDVLGLDPGSYDIMLSLYRGTVDFPFDRLEFGADLKAHGLSEVGNARTVVIRP
jgi:hypothetical protein